MDVTKTLQIETLKLELTKLMANQGNVSKCQRTEASNMLVYNMEVHVLEITQEENMVRDQIVNVI
jgi:hypothetical protein